MKVEKVILKNLLCNENYTRKVLPFVKEEYFLNDDEKILFVLIQNLFEKYNQLPSREELIIEVQSRDNIFQDTFDKVVSTIDEITKDKEKSNEDWMIDATEKFCQEKAIYNALMKSVEIMNGKTKESKGAIPQLLSDALSVSFDPNVGHSYTDDYEERFDYYHRVEQKIPFDLEYFNKITKGGISRKTLCICLSGTGGGKSLFMCHFAAHCLNTGKNVLYITMELAEKEVAKRIDANLLNVSFDDLMSMSKEMYVRRVEKLRKKTNGRLIIKEYPTAGASTTHFRALLNELNLKKSFKPDIIFVDYLNICCSSRIKPGASVNSYSYVKAIAEELRGLAVEYDVPLFSATQTTRQGYSSSDVGMQDVSESFGLPATSDFMFALINTEELEALGQVMVKQLKNRFNDPSINKRFVIGIDRSKMKLYDVEESAQEDIIDSGQDDSPKIKSFSPKDKFSKLRVQ